MEHEPKFPLSPNNFLCTRLKVSFWFFEKLEYSDKLHENVNNGRNFPAK